MSSPDAQPEPKEILGPKNGVWVGLRRCGCCVAVCCDGGEPHMKKHVDAAKREYLKSGLSVVNVTWREWRTKYLHVFDAHCPHQEANRLPLLAGVVDE